MLLTKLKSVMIFVLTMRALALPMGGMAPARLADEPEPKGWGGTREDYEIGVDRTVFHGGKGSGFIKSTAADPKFGTLVQAFKADAYRGKRLRLSGHVKTDGANDGAGLWMRVDSDDHTVSFDNMEKRSIKGNADWKKYDIVLDVPESSVYITFGALLIGKGQMWVDDLEFEVVGKDVASTNVLTEEIKIELQKFDAPEKPVNLDFEK